MGALSVILLLNCNERVLTKGDSLELLGHSFLDGLDDERRLLGDVGLGRGRRDAGQLRHAGTVLTAARNRQK
jgi:hypothetical protein